MDTDEYLDQLRIEGGRLVTAARAAPSVPVPSCPEWDMGQLLAHIEAIHRWVAEILATKATARVTRIGVGDDVGFADLAAAYDAGLAALVAAFEVTDPAEPVWNWSADAPAPAAFWFRRMAQETSVHRWDAEAAAGTPTAIDAALAVDGVDEYLGFVARYIAVHPIEELASTLSLVADDAGAQLATRHGAGPAHRRRSAGGAGDGHGRGLGPVPLAPPPDPPRPRGGDRRGGSRARRRLGARDLRLRRDGATAPTTRSSALGPPVCQGAGAPVSLALETRECQRSHRRPRK